MAAINIVRFPGNNLSDIPKSLRLLADDIEKGEYGDCHNLAWVIDGGNTSIHIGMLGAAPEPGVTAHFLYALAMRRLEFCDA